MDADTSRVTASDRCNGHRRGFTLIELLVVVAIIALLVSILLPSLKRARDQAKAVVCSANLGQMCRAESSYQSENKEWIPGSPWTTGYWFLTSTAGAMWNPILPGFNRLSVNMFDYVTPLRATMLGSGSISRDRGDLIMEMTQEPFACPVSQEIASRWTGSTLPGPNFIRAVSQMTMTTMMNPGPLMYQEVSRNPSRYPGAGLPGHVAQSDAWEIAVPAGYMPRHNRLGREQLKVFVADGLRFFDNTTNNITYTTATRDAKGMTCATPPSTGGTSYDYGREYNLARSYSYRHGSNNRINAGFFDGHVEGLTLGPDRTQTKFTGKAVHPQYYYPSGSVINNPTALHMDTIAPGTVLP
ncbi:MAG TPA: type II secretion system protein [Phycisphaerae bacterium]|nr:type II secretion system protein [Phycisphaerae bacterium]